MRKKLSLADLFEAVENHGNKEGTETQLGDAELFLKLAIAYMTAVQFKKFMASDEVTEFIAQEAGK